MNPFDYLGIGHDAGLLEARSAYRRLAKACHPDRHPDDPEAAAKFAALSEAYKAAIKKIEARPDGSAAGEAGRWKPSTHRTVWREVSVNVALAISGGEVVVPGASGICPHCDGEGRLPLGYATECSTCGGTGKGATKYGGFVAVSLQCHDCDGTGRTEHVACHHCGGFGVSSTAECRVVLPAGVREGDSFVIEGAASIPSENVKGDVQVLVKIVDDRFRICGDDVETTVWLEVWEAAAGGTATVPLPASGRVQLRYPAGTAHGRRFVMKGRGMERLADNGRGDFVAVAAVKAIDGSSSEVAAALEALKAAVLADRQRRRAPT